MSNIRRMIDFYNSQVDAYAAYCTQRGITDRKNHVDKFIDTDPTKYQLEPWHEVLTWRTESDTPFVLTRSSKRAIGRSTGSMSTSTVNSTT